jgi:hypothetical protein
VTVFWSIEETSQQFTYDIPGNIPLAEVPAFGCPNRPEAALTDE